MVLNSGHRLPLFAAERADGVFEAMIEVILDQRPFGIDDRLFNSMKLLGNVQAGPPALDHGDHALQVAFGPP